MMQSFPPLKTNKWTPTNQSGNPSYYYKQRLIFAYLLKNMQVHLFSGPQKLTVLDDNGDDKAEDYVKSLQLKPVLPSDEFFDKELINMVPNLDQFDIDKKSNFAIPMNYVVQDLVPSYEKNKTKFWPNAIIYIARSELDEAFNNREEDNELIANRIFFRLVFNFPWEYFFVAVCNAESTSQMTNNFELETQPGKNGLSSQLIYEVHYKTRSYVIFRSKCADYDVQKSLFPERYEAFKTKWM